MFSLMFPMLVISIILVTFVLWARRLRTDYPGYNSLTYILANPVASDFPQKPRFLQHLLFCYLGLAGGFHLTPALIPDLGDRVFKRSGYVARRSLLCHMWMTIFIKFELCTQMVYIIKSFLIVKTYIRPLKEIFKMCLFQISTVLTNFISIYSLPAFYMHSKCLQV